MDEATSSKAPIAKLADKVSGVFVPVVISIALIAVIVWLLLGYGFEFALSIGISVPVSYTHLLLRAQRNVELFFAEEKNTTEKTQSR